ncbi:MAG TPA: hypothetical protein VEA60_13965, partial [Allosphingosinicella sp.]|nr:hypothetical protein [Allosphingosinicella sp.]
HVGAYGWVEDLEPRPGALEPATLDAEQQAVFDAPGAAPLMRDSANYGHIHAPSPDHAVTAAILRNGHLANATPGEPDLLAVDLGSERVRLAQEVIEGMRNGQTLGALLGYRLERALHDEPDLFLDRLIYDLRRHFPLVGNRNRRTRVAALPKITQVEARNVIDGVAFAEHVEGTGLTNYPYGLSDLPPLTEFTGPGLPGAAAIGALIDGHVATMRGIGDAVADLGVAEGVFQVVRGNFDRAAGSLDAFSKGLYPPETEVVATPRSGRTLTHRLGLQLAGGVPPTATGIVNPRAKGEPALAQWLAERLPDPATVFARVIWQDHSGADVSLTPSMADLGLDAADLFYSIDSGGAREMAGFDDLLIDFAERNGSPAPRHDAVFSLEYKPEGTGGITLFELAPLVRSLRGLVMGARPLRPTDLSLQNEASKGEDAGIVLRADKVQSVRALLDSTRPPVAAFLGTLAAAIEGVDPEAARDSARDSIDQWIEDYAALVRAVAPFGLQAASLTAAVESRRRPMRMMLEALGEIITRWGRKSDEFDSVMAVYDALPDGAPDAEREALLIRAGRTISSTVIAPLPPIAGLELAVAALKTSFDTERDNLIALRAGGARTGALLNAITAFLPTIRQIDLTPFELGPFRDAVLALAQDLAAKAGFLAEDLDRRISEADAALAGSAAAVGDSAQAKLVEAAQAMLGKAFILLPEFRLDPARLAEWANVWADRGSLTDHLETGAEATPFPVDDWLHGLARVRERARELELAGLLGATLGTGEIDLEALQFPYRPDDVWLGMRFPASFRDGSPFAIEGDMLLYTAHFGPGAEVDPADSGRTYSGLMIDEWVEVIPGTQERTGLAFHYDRPNTEAPQAILLVTPPALKGAWDWQDIVGAMHETLDFARLRAVEPALIDRTDLGPLLPAIISAVTLFPVTAMLNFALNNKVHIAMAEADG